MFFCSYPFQPIADGPTEASLANLLEGTPARFGLKMFITIVISDDIEREGRMEV